MTQRELECTFAPKINQCEYQEIEEKDPYATGQRLFNYSHQYNKNREVMKENSKEVFSFKPVINKNTDIILKNRENYLEFLKKKFDNKLKWKSDGLNNRTDYKYESPSNRDNIDNNIDQKYTINILPIDDENFLNEEINKCDAVVNQRPIEERPLNREVINTIKSKIKYHDSPLKIERQSSARVDSNNLTNINTTKFKNPYYLEKLTDVQLLEIANNYITTDESLDKFNKIGNNPCIEEIKTEKIVDNSERSSNQNSLKRNNKKMFPDKIKKVEELPKNVKNALEYFKLAAN